jgi:DNA-binding response OmpR family regulator
MKIMVLEDETAINKSICKMLEFKKYRVESYLDGKKALDAIRNGKYDLFIIDIHIPGPSGLEVLPEVKRAGSETPAIIISSSTDIETISGAYDRGCDEYLKKPFHLRELEIKVEKLLSEKTTLIQLENGFAFDREKLLLYQDGREVDLTPKGLKFVELLVANVENVVTYDKIEAYIWGNKTVSQTALRTLVKRIRQTLDRELIRNIPGIGYKVSKEKEEEEALEESAF